MEEAFKKVESLVHLDLSFNGFKEIQSKKISKILNDNHSIFGFHFEGNFGVIDNLQFVEFPKLEN